MTLFQKQTKLPNELLLLVGTIAAEWSYIESLIESAIGEIIGLDKSRSIFLTTNLGFRSRIHLLESLGNQLKGADEKKGKKFLKILEKLGGANVERNKYVHAVWVMDPDSPHPKRCSIRIKGKIQIYEDPVPLADLRAVADSIFSVGQEFLKYLHGTGILKTA